MHTKVFLSPHAVKRWLGLIPISRAGVTHNIIAKLCKNKQVVQWTQHSSHYFLKIRLYFKNLLGEYKDLFNTFFNGHQNLSLTINGSHGQLDTLKERDYKLALMFLGGLKFGDLEVKYQYILWRWNYIRILLIIDF